MMGKLGTVFVLSAWSVCDNESSIQVTFGTLRATGFFNNMHRIGVNAI